MSKEFAGPDVEGLFDQCQARDGDDDQLCFELLCYPEARQALACAARHNHFAPVLLLLNEVFLSVLECLLLVPHRLKLLRSGRRFS